MQLKNLTPGEVFCVQNDKKTTKTKWEYLGTKSFRTEQLYLFRPSGEVRGFLTDNGELEVFIYNPLSYGK